MPITVISVAKSYSNRGNHRHRQGTKKHWYLYYIDDDRKFRTRRINALEAMYYKGKKCHRYQIACAECCSPLLVYTKSLKDDVVCPYCDCMISLDELDDDDIDPLVEDNDESQDDEVML